MTIARLLMRSAKLWGERPALIDPAQQRSITFADLAAAMLSCGHGLRRRGLDAGDRVAVLGDGSAEYLATGYGIMAAGLVRVPLDPSLSPQELSNQILDAGARLVLFDAGRAECAMSVAERMPNADVEFSALDLSVFDKARVDDFADEDVVASALASLNYTGGTSGEPKAVMLGHDNMRAIVQNIVMARAMGPGDVMVNMRPLWPIAGIIVLAHLAAGGTVVLGGKFQADRMVSLLAEYQAAATSMVPTHLVRVMRECVPSALRSLGALRSIDIGAAAVPTDIFEQALDAFGPKIGVLYGLTEASWSCYQPPAALDAPPEVRRARIKSVGRPVFGCDVMIVGLDEAVPAGQTGEILVRGSHVMKGYWKRADLTAQVLKDGWFSTGDLGRLDNDGTLSVTGRIKEVIRSGGKSVQPNEVEDILCQHPGVAEVSVVGLPHTEWGEVVTALVVTTPGAEISELILKEHCAARLSPHKRPKHIQFVDELPKSHYGKIQRGKVRAVAAEHLRGNASHTAKKV
jgi:acyl-CoA synthetase (AMP-forming)/AMP-acid ligase II